MKFAHLIACGLIAAIAFPAAASARDTGKQAATETAATTSEPTAPTSDTLFEGQLDIPIADGSTVPSDCQFPESLRNAANLDLACITSEMGAEEVVDMEYIAWLGQHGFRHSADIIGGFAATRETENGCEQQLNIYPHDGENEGRSGIWFALEREPRCGAEQQNP